MVRRRSVLCAEDDESVAFMLRALLEHAGFEVEWAPNGEAALQCIQSTPAKYRLLLTDHEMPLMDGLELVSGIRQTTFAGGVMVYSSALTRSIEESYRSFGVSNFLAKPVEASRLLAEIARVLESGLADNL
jgi:CheY-like chemotaxis protein